MTTLDQAIPSRIQALPYHRFLPRLYRLLLNLSKRHGLFTLARFHQRCFGGEQRVVIPQGGSLVIPDDPHYFGFLAGVHEPHVARIIRDCVRPGDTCLDVGANIGYFSMMMACVTGPQGRVYSFEPVPSTFEFLTLNAALAATQGLRIQARQAAVSSKTGELVIEHREHSTLNQVREAANESDAKSDRIPSITLNDFLRTTAITGRVKLLKVDVEGHELAVLEGALNVLQSRQIETMIIEVTPGEDATRISEILASCGASIQCWIDGRWQSTKITDSLCRTDALVSFPAAA
jgi:FkbM family methyltransferase